jgi:hypothetical protein
VGWVTDDPWQSPRSRSRRAARTSGMTDLAIVFPRRGGLGTVRDGLIRYSSIQSRQSAFGLKLMIRVSGSGAYQQPGHAGPPELGGEVQRRSAGVVEGLDFGLALDQEVRHWGVVGVVQGRTRSHVSDSQRGKARTGNATTRVMAAGPRLG